MIYENFIGLNQAFEKENALTFKQKTFSSEELREKVGILSAKLENFSITPQHRIGILIGNTPLFICALLAVARLRASAVLFSTHFKTYELENYIHASHLRLIVSDEKSGNLVHPLSYNKEQILKETDSLWGNLEIWRLSREDEPCDVIPLPQNWEDKEFTLQFTSGVGGKSKIVPRSYRQVWDEIVSYVETTHLTSRDTIICPAPLFHAYGLINGFLAPIHAGASIVLMERFIPNDFIQWVRIHKPTIFIGVPFMYNLLTQTYLEEAVDFSSFRICFSAGAKLSKEVAERFTARFGVRINQQYGSTETGTMSVNLYRDGFDDVDSIGLPLPGRRIKIVNETNHDLPVGEDGEIKIQSPGTTSGYLHLEELNKQKFKEGWYFTGDIGHMDARGNTFITGRKIAFINVAGLKVDPFEVEKTLLLNPHIKECAVVGKLDKTNHQEIVKAFIVPGGDISIKEIKHFCKERLADYKIPREIEFVNELPKSPTGKILMKYLSD